ncbi:zinc ribbon-containing protein [Gayadomonas joobiniege]|uniref:zinc ribbon-containing protein n=1 Tax=Gayadomonas joobiniege TaxID=1234606 RepID=UPI00035DA7AE|nr:hypothetical protein [Gayadomonas joobiniege]
MQSSKNGYQSLQEKLRAWLNEGQQQTQSLVEGIEFLREYVQTGYEINRDDLTLSLEYLQRDLAYFYETYHYEGQESAFYLAAKDNFWHTLAEMTDRTQLEWREFSSDMNHKGTYQAGEEVAFGLLKCQHCGETIEINHVQKIHPCFNCQHENFSRIAAAP